MSDDPQDIPLEQVLELHKQSVLDGVHTSMPGQIVEYDSATQRASVQPLVKKSRLLEDDTEVVEPLPIVHDVIVMQLGAARGRITFPIAVGDTCLLFFANCSIANWRMKGGVVDPIDPRRHDISDAVALVGLHDFAHVPSAAPADAVVVNLGDGVTMKVGSSSAAKAVQTTDDGAQFLNCLANAIVTAGAGPPPNPTGAAALTALYTALTGGAPPSSPPSPAVPWPTGSGKLSTDG